MVTLDTALKNGDIVEILTASNIHETKQRLAENCKNLRQEIKLISGLKKKKEKKILSVEKIVIEKEVKKQGFLL